MDGKEIRLNYIKLVYLVIPLIIFSAIGLFGFYEVRNGPEIVQPFDISHKYHVQDLVYLFNIGADARDLDQKKISPSLRETFEKQEISLSQKAAIKVVKAGERWNVNDEAGTWIVRKEKQELKVYKKGEAMKCEDCHVGVRTTYASTRPKIQSCLACKDSILEGEDEKSKGLLYKKKKGLLKENEKIFMEYLQKEKPIPWKPLYQLKRHVYFSHFRHVTAGKIDCKTCHGDFETIETMPERPIIETFFMYTCMDCHEKKGVSNDCMVCHR